MDTKIFCTQCSQSFPGDPTEVDEPQILIPERYSTLIRKLLEIKLMDRSRFGREHDIYTWNSLLSLWEAHATKHKMPSVAGDCVTLVSHPDNDTAEGLAAAELGRASLSYVRAVDELRREGQLTVLPDGKILYVQQ
jgi:hypothetical protein